MRLRRSLTLLPSLCALLAFSCATGPDVGEKAKKKMRTLEHRSGLIIGIDDSFTAVETKNGYVLRPRDADVVRSPTEIEVTLEPGRTPAGSWPKTKDVNGTTVHYRITEDPGGSGGAEYTLTGWQTCAEWHITLRQRVQAETEQEADFASGFEVLGTARCAPTAR